MNKRKFQAPNDEPPAPKGWHSKCCNELVYVDTIYISHTDRPYTPIANVNRCGKCGNPYGGKLLKAATELKIPPKNILALLYKSGMHAFMLYEFQTGKLVEAPPPPEKNPPLDSDAALESMPLRGTEPIPPDPSGGSYQQDISFGEEGTI